MAWTFVDLDGEKIAFTRRRYGKHTVYTWAHLVRGDQWYAFGDPYPGVHWPRAILRVCLAETIARIPFTTAN